MENSGQLYTLVPLLFGTTANIKNGREEGDMYFTAIIIHQKFTLLHLSHSSVCSPC
jgi:hypothetical protein